jgi:hypothetical protein
LFVDDSGQWLLLTDATTQQSESGDLLTAGESRFMPLARPALGADTRASILVPAQASEGADVGVDARVVTLDGKPVEAGDVEWHRPLLAGLNGTRWIPGTLSTEGLAVGDYRLEVTASWGETTPNQTRTTDFTVED